MLVGNSLAADPVSVALDDQGGMTLLFAVEVDGVARLQVKHFDRRLDLAWESVLQESLRSPMQPEIIWHGQRLRLFWIDEGSLYSATMDAGGNDSGDTRLLSNDAAVDSYGVALRGTQPVTAWFAGGPREPGLYAVNDVASSAEPVLVDDQGIEPELRVDAEGGLHAVWLRYPPGTTSPSFYYAYYGSGQVAGSDGRAGTLLLTAFAGLSSVLTGPFLGVDDEHVYVFWTVEVRTGPQAGSAETNYIIFPLGRPAEIGEEQSLYAPADYNLDYEPATGTTLHSGSRVPLPVEGALTAPMDLESNREPASELVVATQVMAAYELRKEARQSALIYFRDGRPVSYQLLSFTRSGSSFPYVRSDGQGYLYATWLEPAEPRGFLTYLSATAPDVNAALTTVSLSVVSRVVTELVFGLLSGAVLAPFAGILWLIAPLVVLAVTSFMRREAARGISPGSAASLGLAIITYWLVKMATLPGIGDFVPFSPWIPFIPPWLGVALQWSVIPLILLAALVTAWHFTYRRDAPSALYFLFIYAAVDSVLSMAVYGSIIYGFV